MDESIGPHTRLDYQGSELELFAKAANWKRYWSSKVRPFIAGNVIEVGAGLGTSTEYLCERHDGRWVCLEPDPRFASHLADRISAGELPACCKAACGVLADLDPTERADTILYIDVLEHIETEFLDAVLLDLKDITRDLGFFSVHTGPAAKHLPDGRNAHLIQRSSSWWLPKFCQHFEIAHLQGSQGGFWVLAEPRSRA